MAKTIVGSFDNFDEAQRVARDLLDEGLDGGDINVVASNLRGDFAQDGRADHPDANTTTRGAVTGGLLGGAAGLALGLMGLSVPGIGHVLAAGPLAATLAGAGAGVLAGGLIGGLTDLGVSRTDAEYYAESVRRGGALVTVRADEACTAIVVDIMREHGAVDIDRRAEQWRDDGWKGYDATAAAYTREDMQRDRLRANRSVSSEHDIDVAATRPAPDYARNPGLRH